MPLRVQKARQEPTLEAEILPGDTLTSISLRFNCKVQDIKRINKIDKDNEIFAFKVLKVPLTPQNILLDTLPKVHTSGQNSPTNKEKVANTSSASDAMPSKEKLEEKLLLASVSNAVIAKPADAADLPVTLDNEPSVEDSLIDHSQFRGYPTMIRGNDYLSFNGSDCEMNWICLLFCILAVCVIVPLIYVYLVYEHPEEYAHHSHSKFDDTDLHYMHHLSDKNYSTTRGP